MWETWVKSHEVLAIWIEGIALVLIFALDTVVFIVALRDRRRQHGESAARGCRAATLSEDCLTSQCRTVNQFNAGFLCQSDS